MQKKKSKVRTSKWKYFPSGNTVALYDLCTCVMMAAGINIVSYSGGKGHENVRVTSHQRPLCDWRTSVGGVALKTGQYAYMQLQYTILPPSDRQICEYYFVSHAYDPAMWTQIFLIHIKNFSLKFACAIIIISYHNYFYFISLNMNLLRYLIVIK